MHLHQGSSHFKPESLDVAKYPCRKVLGLSLATSAGPEMILFSSKSKMDYGRFTAGSAAVTPADAVPFTQASLDWSDTTL
jgi:hypothetical protein